MDALTSALEKIEDADRLYTPETPEDTAIVILTLAEINALRELAR
jgi:predicted DNA-binding protein (UPF0251 family)